MKFKENAKELNKIAKEEQYKIKLSCQHNNQTWFLSSINCQCPNMNDILAHCIDQIWFKYDEDNSGYLDREEAKKFVMESVNKSEDEENLPKKKLSNMERE